MSLSSGVWWLDLQGADPAETASRWFAAESTELWNLDEAALCAGDSASPKAALLVPNARWRDGMWEHLVAHSAHAAGSLAVEGAAFPAQSVWTPGRLFEVLGGDRGAQPAATINRALLVEAGRAVTSAIRENTAQFPWLAASPMGPTLPEALADLVAEFGYAGLDSRSPGAVTIFQKLQPMALGQELVRAVGMMEGGVERLASTGRRSTWQLRRQSLEAAEYAATSQRQEGGLPGQLLVAGFDSADSFDQLLIDALRYVGRFRPVIVLFEAPEASAAQRAISWLGAAKLGSVPWVGEAVTSGLLRPPDSSDSPDADSTEPKGSRRVHIEAAGPADTANAAVEAAITGPGGLQSAVVIAPRPEVWRPFLEEACAARGLWLVGDCGAPPKGWGLRFIEHLLRAWVLGLSSARAVDLVQLGTLLRLSADPDTPPFAASVGKPRRRKGRRGPSVEPWDQLDLRLRQRGVRRDHRVIARVGGDAAGLIGALFERLDAAEDASAQLREVALLCRDLGFWRRCVSSAALIAGRETGEVAALASAAEEFASALDVLWPAPLIPPCTPQVLGSRVGALISTCASKPGWRAPPPGIPLSDCVRLQPPDRVLSPAVRHVVIVDLLESVVERLGRSSASSLIPDSVRRDPEVTTLVPLVALRDKVIQQQQRLTRLASGNATLGCERATIVLPKRDVQGRETVPWAQLVDVAMMDGHEPPADLSLLVAPILPRQQRYRPQPVAAQRGQSIGGKRGVAATVVDAYRACPRRFYLERILQVRDREPVRFDVDSRQRGNWLHALIHQLFVVQPKWWREAEDPEVLAQTLGRLTLRASDRLVTGASDPFLRLQRAALLARAAQRLCEHAEIMRAQAGPPRRRHPEMAVVGLEVSMRATAEGVPGLRLRGTLDRLDLIFDRRGQAVGSVVVDYKTGQLAPYGLAATSAEQERLQLLLYAHLAERMLKIPCLGAVAVPVLDPGRPRGIVLADPAMPAAHAWVDSVGPSDVVDAAQFRSAVQGALQATREVVQAVKDGHFEASPRTDRECGFCPQSLYCERVRR